MPFHRVKVAQRNELLIIDFSACRNEHFIFLFIFLYSNRKCDGLPNKTWMTYVKENMRK